MLMGSLMHRLSRSIRNMSMSCKPTQTGHCLLNQLSVDAANSRPQTTQSINNWQNL